MTTGRINQVVSLEVIHQRIDLDNNSRTWESTGKTRFLCVDLRTVTHFSLPLSFVTAVVGYSNSISILWHRCVCV